MPIRLRLNFGASLFLCWLGLALPLYGLNRQDAAAVRYDSSMVSVRQPPAQSLQRFLNEEVFLYDRAQPPAASLWEQFKRWFWQQGRKFFSSRANEIFWRLFSYALVAAALIFVIAQLLKTEVRGLLFNRGERFAGNFHESAENIHALDFDRLLAEAIQQQRYRVAVRWSYLALLKKLADKNLIEWRLEKTNHDYLAELKPPELRPVFAEATRLFEYIWYGEFAVQEADFKQMQDYFGSFKE